MDGEWFFPSGGSLVWIRPHLKEITGGGNGPFPLGATDLVEEMSALLARRKRNAEKGSTVERERKEDKTGFRACDSWGLFNKYAWTDRKTLGKNKYSEWQHATCCLQVWFSEEKSQALWFIPQTKLCTLVTGQCQQSPDGAPGLGQRKQDSLDEMRKEFSQKKSSLMQSSQKGASQMLPRETN